MANRCGNNGNSDRLYFGVDSKITADGDCSHEIKRFLLLGRKTVTTLDRILKNRDIIFLTRAHLVKAMLFPVVMYGCEIWTIKKAECGRIDIFELWGWRRLLRVPCWNWNSNTLATGWEELTHLKSPWCWERLKAGGEGDNKGWDGWMASLTQWTGVWLNSRSWWWTGRPGMLQSMGL